MALFDAQLVVQTLERLLEFDGAMERAQDVLFSGQSARTLPAFRREQRLRHQLHQPLHAQVSNGSKGLTP